MRSRRGGDWTLPLYPLEERAVCGIGQGIERFSPLSLEGKTLYVLGEGIERFPSLSFEEKTSCFVGKEIEGWDIGFGLFLHCIVDNLVFFLSTKRICKMTVPW